MKTYLSLFKIKFISNLQYRAEALAGVATQFFFGIVYIMVYVAFYESSKTGNYPMDLPKLVSYLWLNQSFFALVYMWSKEKDLLLMIKNGNVAYEMVRPINFYLKWYVTYYANKISMVLLRFLPILIIAYLLPAPYNLSLPSSLPNFVLFLVALTISGLLVSAIGMIFHVITFFTLNEKGVLTAMMAIADVLSGGVIPLAFFPNLLQKIAYILPFRFVCDLPFNIYTGNIGINTAVINIGFSIMWTIICFLIGYLLTRKALKRAVIQGG